MRNNVAIFVHGSWVGGWCWQPLADALRAYGIDSICPTLSGMSDTTPASAAAGLRVHLAEVLALIDGLDDRVALVGHSYGSMVVSEAAAERPDRVHSCILMDSVVPQAGRSLFEMVDGLRERFAPRMDPAMPAFIPPPNVDYLGPKPELADEVARQLKPIPVLTHEERARHSANDLACERHYIGFRDFPGRIAIAEQAARDGWNSTLLDGGHLTMMNHPAMVARVIAPAIIGASAPAGA